MQESSKIPMRWPCSMDTLVRAILQTAESSGKATAILSTGQQKLGDGPLILQIIIAGGSP